jgi:hypothetical protein
MVSQPSGPVGVTDDDLTYIREPQLLGAVAVPVAHSLWRAWRHSHEPKPCLSGRSARSDERSRGPPGDQEVLAECRGPAWKHT